MSNANQITVDGNNDNSINTNAFNVNNGANCITVTLGSIQLKKQFVGGPSNQRANLLIKEGATVKASASDVGPTTGQTSAASVLPGSFDISETAGSNTDLNNYTRTYSCTKNGLPFVADTSLGSSASVAVGTSDVVVCTITNTFVKKNPTVATTIHDVNHAAVLTVPVGTTVHDSAVVTGVAGLPGPTGNVTFQWFTNDQCDGSPVDSSSSFALSGGSVDGTTFTKAPVTFGGYAFRAVYDGDVVYNAKTGPCEPLAVTKIDPVVATTIHDGSHGAVLSVATGTTVHDSATRVGWVPWIMNRLDKEYLERRREVPHLRERPSHYIRQFFYGTQPIEEPVVRGDIVKVFELFDGERTAIFASDWPHHDFDHPQHVFGLPFSPVARRPSSVSTARASTASRCPSATWRPRDRIASAASRGPGRRPATRPAHGGAGGQPRARNLQHQGNAARAAQPLPAPARAALRRRHFRHAGRRGGDRLEAGVAP